MQNYQKSFGKSSRITFAMATTIYIVFTVLVLTCGFVSGESTKCVCAIFHNQGETIKYISNEEPKPEIAKIPEKLISDETGKVKCEETCLTLAKEITNGKPGEAFCKITSHSNNVLGALYYREETGDWKRTPMVAKEPICCHDFKVVPCKAA